MYLRLGKQATAATEKAWLTGLRAVRPTADC